MKALILNSGLGSRMGNLTKNMPKCMVPLTPTLTIIDFQIQQLISYRVQDVIITTGPFANVLQQYLSKYSGAIEITYVQNSLYNKTNYIYSIALAERLLRNDDIILMHGDLIFAHELLEQIISHQASAMVIDTVLPLPDKDFKAVIHSGLISKIGIEYFTDACAAQPLYKWCGKDMNIWLDNILRFCKKGDTGVYAENAFNEISEEIQLYPLDAQGHLCMEVDNLEDLKIAQERIKGEAI